jgi:phytoene dehydrogenase-like protein
MSDDADVVIVGAGLAGLRAAQVLHAAGVAVLVLDRADRVGGRLASSTTEGFVLDEGFQLINPAYPELIATGVLEDFDLRSFAPEIRFGDGCDAVTVGDPRYRLRHARGSLRHPDLSPGDALRLARLFLKIRRQSAAHLLRGPDTTTRRALLERGVRARTIDGLLGPFLRGALLDDELATSWHYCELVLKSLLTGRPGTHPRGVVALPEAMASALSRTQLRLGEPAVSISARGVTTPERHYRCRAVIVASDPSNAHRLLGTPDVSWRAQTTWWWSLPALNGAGQLRIDTRRRVLASALALSSVAPERAPRGRSLVVASANGVADGIDDRDVRGDVARLYDVSEADLTLIDRTLVRRALPVVATPLDLGRSQDVGGVIVAGDYLQTPSIQGALVSGRRAARLALWRVKAGP